MSKKSVENINRKVEAMNTIVAKDSPKSSINPVFERKALDRILFPLEDMAGRSEHLLRTPAAKNGAAQPPIPRYFYLGERGGGDVFRLGIFAGIHGDEPEGALAVNRFVTMLERDPEIARGFALFLYPVCNPTGLEDGTRHARSGKDLNREFWRQSAEAEVRFLESEIYLHAFDGLVTLHSDNTSKGVYGYVNGSILSENLLEPALRAAEKFLPRDRRHVIDGFPSRDGIIYRSFEGVLRSLPGMERPPFELTFETPQRAPLYLQVEAAAAALQTILQEYRQLRSFAQNI
jgi:murein peptide amidase A